MNAAEVDVPDSIRPYLDEIAERLWAERAAVMVGAGFSKNAGGEFPDWNQLGDIFYQKAHGVKPDPAKTKYLNVLRLAEEIQASIGRPALENLLRSSLPDLNVQPSSLHIGLLELPWVDVFTTNYDTLLERASAKVVTRRYQPVVNKEDIPYANKPRIVKLHGSFPSERPFIITEEDYRTYPHDFAPFVNTVQQALLENTFCLIGFSGDDPNFLQWIGWIRDNLGKDKTQKIFLVGVFDLSPARLQLLAQRGIVVVDYSHCDGIGKHDHKIALGRFFAYIQSKRPHALDWPYNPRQAHPNHDTSPNDEIRKVTDEWRHQRQEYPGWLILPHSSRERVWAYTQDWIHYLPNAENSPPGLDIQYTCELIWRLEKCLLPVFDNIAELCEKLIVKYWPFQDGTETAGPDVKPKNDKSRTVTLDNHRQAWLTIAVAMLRFYREQGHLEKWRETNNRLKTASDYLTAEQREILQYEAYLFSLFSLDLPSAKQQLENWRPTEAQPYWMAKRAAALAEIGLLGEAETIAREALDNIRKKLNQRDGTKDLTLVSEESYAMLLSKSVQDAVAIGKGEWGALQEKRAQLNDRWSELKGFKCDPWNELKLFDLSLNEPAPQRKSVTEKRAFDIGLITRTHHICTNHQDELDAYAFLRFCEEVGLPYRIRTLSIGTKTALASVQRISRYSSVWAMATIARLGDTAAVDNLFSREAVYRLTADEADQLIDRYLGSLNKCRDDIHTGDVFRNTSYGVRLAQLLPEVISRLCCRCSGKAKHRILEFISELYASPDRSKYKGVRSLTQRLICSMSEIEQYLFAADFLKVPFPSDLHATVEKEYPNPLLLLKIYHKPRHAEALTIQPELIDHLFQQAKEKDITRRRWAIASLMKMRELQILNERQRLAQVIWEVTDQYGLPDGTDFYRFAFLRIPHPDGLDSVKPFKAFVRSTPLPIARNENGNGLRVTDGNIPIIDEIIGANGNGRGIWTAGDAVEILERLVNWWDADKDGLEEREITSDGFRSRSAEYRARLSRIVDLLAKVVGPRLTSGAGKEVRSSLNRLLEEMRGCGLPCLEAEAACLHVLPDLRTGILARIDEALNSFQQDAQRDGLQGVANLLLNKNQSKTFDIAHTPASMLSQCLTWYTAPTLNSALRIIVRLLRDSPTNFTDSIKDATQQRLHRLLSETSYDGNSPVMDFAERLEIRRIASILTAELWDYYSSRSLTMPEVIKKWQSACLAADEFAEVQNPWLDKGHSRVPKRPSLLN